MQPSELEIRREVEALRDIRRRSTAGGPGSLILDPDLPSTTTQPSPTTPYWSPEELSGSSQSDNSDTGSEESNNDPFHLFWVPARLHPEIAPAEFRQFLKEHARSPSDEPSGLGRSVSNGSTDLGRKKSMLSRQYKPSANDDVEDEEVVPIRRNRSSIYSNGPQLTISDLQKLEELAEEASNSDDPSRLRSVLRRSLSLNVAPSVIDQMDDLHDPGDEADSPIIVPRMGDRLRRSARTKIRKPGMQGEGAHRFTATRSRRKSVNRSATLGSPRTSSEMSVSDHGHAEASRTPRASEDAALASQIPPIPPVPPLPRPESYSEEALIYDAYVTEEPDELDAFQRETTPEPSVESSLSGPSSTTTHTESHELAADSGPILHHPKPQRAVAPAVTEPPVETHTPSPPPTTAAASPPSNVLQPRPSLQEAPLYQPPSPGPSEHRREKDKKGGLFKWGSDKGSKKQAKEKEQREREKEKEKDTGFFGSLFGGKKKQEDAPPSIATQSGRETAAALLGASKSSKNYAPSPSPQLAGMYARYPIHVERAIYRLSHIKLANPRRPLYEQVLISNLMFWYLGVINKTQSQQNAGANGVAQPQPQASGQTQPVPDKEQQEREQREREERERAEKEHLEREQEQREKQRRGSLTKPGAANAPQPGVRRAEMPVRGPQYEMQHRAMEHEYGHGYSNSTSGGSGYGYGSGGGASYQSQPARSSSAPPQPYTVGLVQPQPQAANGKFRNMGSVSMQPQQYAPVVVGGQLPPGAMPPVAVEQTWMANQASTSMLNSRGHSSPSPPRSASPPSPPNQSVAPRRTRSPPPNRYTPAQEKQPSYSAPGARLPSRSLSASAAPPMVSAMNHVNSAKLKKGISAHAVVQSRRRPSEDEDVPLALWQQTRRK
ncbi:uncharacterized protein C8Q71DRAFT_745039 [Rhodofomes roseus]|uniref:Protein Zds1 C-terminal domain-containing protein n=1 Tax=Rhodofomes roseus TaxID=34475 RepID=A0ABQ8KNG0_9APHY|nr:uncharacterized protein C8Q71DRAFT_745039 [Rhodofomes roseus]KAH9839954.1 hypothetical protein C8Q71DRAFT_745039 [Rhodofomes roseus]